MQTTLKSRGGQRVDRYLPVDRDQLFGRSRALCGVYQNLLANSVLSVALRLTAFFGSTYLCEEAFSPTKIIK